MKAAVLHNSNQKVSIEDIRLTPPDPSWVAIELQAAALNHRDLWIMKGQYAGLRFPIVLGSDGAGLFRGQKVVFNPGYNWGKNSSHQDQSFGIIGMPYHGTLCQQVYVPSENIYPAPSHLSLLEAAAIPLAGITAWRCLMSRCMARAGERVLITGIGGGVALMAMQFSLAAGLDVFVTSGDDDKIRRAVALGAKHGVNYKKQDWDKELAQTARKFDIIVDSAAGKDFGKLVKLAAGGARIGIYGGTCGEITQLSPQQIFWKQINIFGSTMGTNEEFAAMLKFIEHHSIVPIIDKVFSWDEVNDAFDRMDSQAQFGKLVIDLTR